MPENLSPVPVLGLGARVLRRHQEGGHRAVTTLPGYTRDSVSDARKFVSTTAAAWGIPREQTDDLVQIVSEFAANAVEHAPGVTMTITAALMPGAAMVSVTDRGPGRTLRAEAASKEAERGRGLAIVADLAQQWGHVVMSPGTRVWARVVVPTSTYAHRPAGGAA